jgi:hypothetical protein
MLLVLGTLSGNGSEVIQIRYLLETPHVQVSKIVVNSQVKKIGSTLWTVGTLLPALWTPHSAEHRQQNLHHMRRDLHHDQTHRLTQRPKDQPRHQ